MKQKSLSILITLALSGASLADTGYYRFPATDGQQLVFTAEGDLWRASLNGGSAQRLTTHLAQETHAALSPDGKWLAFSANYDGPTEAYVMPTSGGAAQRVSFENGRAQVLGWTAAGEVLYTAQAERGPARMQVLVRVHPQTRTRQVLPLADANEACLADDGKTLFFTRFGLHTTTDNARQYRGGTVGQLWKFDLGRKQEAVRLAGEEGAQLRRPMCVGNRLFFLADIDGVDNLWSMNFDGSDRKQHTRHKHFTVQNPTAGGGRIVYQHGADLRVFDTRNNEDKGLTLDLVSDFTQQRERWLKAPKYISNSELSASGERVVITARGHLAVANTTGERRVEIALPKGVRARSAVLSVDGKSVYAITDLSGDNEIWQFAADGSGQRKQLTKDGGVHRFKLELSPNGKWLAHDDKNGRLFLLDLSSGSNTQIDDGGRGGASGYDGLSWAPDSRTLAYTRPDTVRGMDQVVLYALDSKTLHVATSDKYSSGNPVFSRDGKWLYFFSDRVFNPNPSSPWGDRNMGPAFDKRSKLYALALADGLRFPFQPKDELNKNGAEKPAEKAADAKAADAKISDAKNADAKAADSKSGADKPAAPAFTIAFEGLADRLHEVPLPNGNYRGLALDDKRIYFVERDDSDPRKANLKTLEISNDSPKPDVFAADVAGFSLSANGKKILFSKPGDNGPGPMYIVDAGGKAPADLSKNMVRIGDWQIEIDPKAEWKQMFHDAWRMHRDYLFDPNMRGVDWAAMRDKYAPLVERITDRNELDDLLAQMVAEVSVLHSQVRGGEYREEADAPRAAFLGGTFEKVTDGYRITHIYRSEAELPNERAPLAQRGVDARVGDVIVAINARDARDSADLSELIQNRVGQQVLLTIKRGEKTHQTVVTPVDGGRNGNLRYGDWEEGVRLKVEAEGKGRIGYLHLRAMTAGDVSTFAREFYANFDRDGLVIDVRRNGGGNIDSWIIEKLLRRAWAFWYRPGAVPYWNQQQTFRGHLVVVTDQHTYSDGETFSAGVKSLGLGPLVGTRTAGAGVWLSDQNRLIDGGMMRAAENAQFSMDGRWVVEGRGVSPDVEVDNLPFATFNGGDAQLDAALALLKKKISEQPVTPLKPGPVHPVGKPADDVR